MLTPTLALLLVLVLAVVAVAPPPTPPAEATPTAALPLALALLSHQGRWLTDPAGRVVLLHGVNFVSKGSLTPAEEGFGDDDAAWLAANGFELVRLGLAADALMPTPGVIDTAYLDSFVATAHTLTAHGLYVLVDLHQDNWGQPTAGNGFPEWMTLLNGAVNNGDPWPTGYATNPAVSAAFESLWNNQAGPGGVGIADRVAAIWAALADGVGSDPGVLGYDLLNEPWPGTGWEPCLNGQQGCPDLDAARLGPYNARMAAAIRARDPEHLIFGEPFVLFNFGGAPTDIAPPGGHGGGLAFHMYPTSPLGEPKVIANALVWADAHRAPVVAGEFSAVYSTPSPEDTDRQIAELDAAFIPWMWWHYGDSVTATRTDQLVRPHPVAIAGTPVLLTYELTRRTMHFAYSTTGPGGKPYPSGTTTNLDVPTRTYPAGYRVTVFGGTATSQPGADTLTIVANAGSTCVTITVSPADTPPPDTSPPVTSPDTCAPTTTTTAAPTTPVVATPRFTA